MPSQITFWKRLQVAIAVIAVYLFLAAQLVGFKTEQVVLGGFFALMYLSSFLTRRWILGFSIFLVYWIIFDFMKAFPYILPVLGARSIGVGHVFLCNRQGQILAIFLGLLAGELDRFCRLLFVPRSTAVVC